jgi:hypothetical protein
MYRQILMTAFSTSAHLTSKCILEEEIEYSIWDPGAKGVLEIHLIALDDILWILGPPPCHHPADMAETTGYTSPRQKHTQDIIFT